MESKKVFLFFKSIKIFSVLWNEIIVEWDTVIEECKHRTLSAEQTKDFVELKR